MSVTDVAVIVFGLFAGYWVVSKLLFRSTGTGGLSPPPPNPATQISWAEVLEISPDASASEIHEAYGRLRSRYDLDQLSTLGPDFKVLAARKAQAIAVAYEQALKARRENP
jgi:DnaJ-domain-containing protein 1